MEEPVISVLEVLWNMRNVAYEQLQLPAKWCGYRNRSPDLESFLSDYNDMLQRREMGESMNRCAWVQKMVSLMRMGSEYTCHQCLENICNDPAFEIRVNQCVR